MAEAHVSGCRRINGKGWRCGDATTRGAGWCEHHLALARKNDQRPWRVTTIGRAAVLRFSRGYPALDALAIALWLEDPDAACAVCGAPHTIILTLYKRGGPFKRGPEYNNARLTVDRIDQYGPHTLDNTRLACWPCNASRGMGWRSDGSVSDETRSWWATEAPADLRGWLYDRPAPLNHNATLDLESVF